jgi:hypothetical protein
MARSDVTLLAAHRHPGAPLLRKKAHAPRAAARSSKEDAMRFLIIPVAAAVLAAASGYSTAQTVIGGCKIGPKASCAKANLRGAAIANLDLSGADLSGANLQGARASGAKFVGANLQGTDFDSADLAKADFGNANLRNSNLLGARLDGANWSGADLSGAQWTAGRDNYGAPLGRRCAEGSVGACK